MCYLITQSCVFIYSSTDHRAEGILRFARIKTLPKLTLICCCDRERLTEKESALRVCICRKCGYRIRLVVCSFLSLSYPRNAPYSFHCLPISTQCQQWKLYPNSLIHVSNLSVPAFKPASAFTTIATRVPKRMVDLHFFGRKHYAQKHTCKLLNAVLLSLRNKLDQSLNHIMSRHSALLFRATPGSKRPPFPSWTMEAGIRKKGRWNKAGYTNE